MILKIIISSICLILLLLLVGKVYELLWIMNFLRVKGSKYAEEMLRSGVNGNVLYLKRIQAVMEKYDFPMRNRLLFPTKILKSIQPDILSKGLLFFFRYPTLICSLAFIALFLDTSGIQFYQVYMVALGLLVIIMVQSVNLLYHQLILGPADFIQKSVGLRAPYWERNDYEPVWEHNQPFRDFVKLTLRTFLSFIIGFVGIYWCIDELFLRIANGKHAFDSLSASGVERFFQLFYYSLATMTTTGAGPVQPAWIWAKLIASVEILVGISLLIFSILGFSSELQPNFKLKTTDEEDNGSSGGI